MNSTFYKVLFFLCLIEIGVIIFYTQTNSILKYIQDINAPLPTSSPPATIQSNNTAQTPSPVQLKSDVLSEQVSIKNNNPDLETRINKVLEGTTGTYAIVIKNLKTGETFTREENREFEPGSLYKLWVMGTAYKQIESGELTLDDTMSQSIPALNRKFGIDPANAELTSGGITLTVKNALNQMITISHNYAALLLVEKIKLSTVAKYLEDNQFTHSKVGTDGSSPISTASDIAKFFELLYNGKLASQENTEQMITLLKKQQLNNKLPKNLPTNTTIAHKTGEIGMFTHDAGIIYHPSGDYIIVVMSESAIPKAAEERIANISKEVLNYFSGKK